MVFPCRDFVDIGFLYTEAVLNFLAFFVNTIDITVTPMSLMKELCDLDVGRAALEYAGMIDPLYDDDLNEVLYFIYKGR